MSHTANKEALFGPKKDAKSASTSKPASATPSVSTAAVPPPKPVSVTAEKTLKFSGKTTGLSLMEKQKKVAEAKEYSEKGMTHLKTTMFQWKPDHLAAAPNFE